MLHLQLSELFEILKIDTVHLSLKYAHEIFVIIRLAGRKTLGMIYFLIKSKGTSSTKHSFG